MKYFRGEFESKVDLKGRFLLPANLKKQVPDEANGCFMINCGFEGCLNLFPLNEWDKIEGELAKLNMYIKRNREFARLFTNGAKDLELDSSGRILIPKRLLDWASIEKEIVLKSQFNRIEIWSKKLHDKIIDIDPEKYADLGEIVMSGNSEPSGDDELP